MSLKNRFTAIAIAAAAFSFSITTAALANSTYCSDTGDFCVHATDNPAKLDLVSLGFSGKYTLTIKPPKGSAETKTFTLRRSGDAFKSSVRWSKHFTNHGPGVYKATWKLPTPPTTLHSLKFKVG